jgi:hypothetical protein
MSTCRTGRPVTLAMMLAASFTVRTSARPVGRRAHFPQQVGVRPGQRAVTADVGDDVPGTAVRVEPGQYVEQPAAVTGPAAGRQRRAADIEPDRDPLAVPRDRGAHPAGPFQRRGADVDPRAAGRQRRGERAVVADPA